MSSEHFVSQRRDSVVLVAMPYLVFAGLVVLLNQYLSRGIFWSFSEFPIGATAGLVMFGLAGARISYSKIPPAVSIVLRVTLCFSVFYIVASHVFIPTRIIGDAEQLGIIVNYVWLVAATFGLIGLLRPSFGLLTLHFIFWQKQAIGTIFGVPLTAADYITIIDTTGLLIVAVLFVPIFERLQQSVEALRLGSESPARLELLEAALMTGVALHFGNYFYGALGKMAIGEDPLYWIFDNRTELLILASAEVGANPLSFSDDVLRGAYIWFSKLSPIFNFATLAGQLICVILIIRPRPAMLMTAYFDLMHIGIFIFTGIFFWKFILLNLSIVLGFRRMLQRQIPALFSAMLVFLVIVAPLSYNIVYFYWLDSRSMNSVTFWAVDDRGREYRVPGNYFLGLSVTFNQNRIVYPESGMFPTHTWGTTRKLEEFYASETCELKRLGADDPAYAFYFPKDRLIRTIRKYHGYVMENLDERGLFAYDLYPHHIFSVPWEYGDFRALDKRRIRKYRYQIEAVCLGFENGDFIRKVQWREGFEIPLD